MPENGFGHHRVELTVYGIKQCDTCTKALKWLDLRQVSWTFHDFRADGLPEPLLRKWLDSPFAPYLVNKRSTTWRNLSDGEKSAAASDPCEILMKHPTLIKRPVFMNGDQLLAVGFSPVDLEDYI